MKIKFTLVLFFSTVIAFQLSAQKLMFKTGMLVDTKKPVGVELYDFETLGFGEKIPDSVNLSDYAPFPGNQGDYASCVGWAYGYCAMSILYSQKYNLKNRTAITALAMCPFSVYNRIKDPYDSRCAQGTYLHLGAAELKKQGTKRYHISEVGCNESSSKDSVYRIFRIDNSYAIWDNYQEKNVKDSIKILYTKKALAAKTPVIIGFNATYSFAYGVRDDGFWEKDESNLYSIGGHAMCVVGYNDKKFGGAFLIQNSWGQDWGKDGYVWVSYDDYAEYTTTAYVIELSNTKKKVAATPTVKGCEYGDCTNNYSRFKFENGDTYEGDVKAGKANGYVIYQYQNGEVYTGGFKAGKKEGKGTYYFSDGTIKVAYWQADTINAGGDYLEYGFGTINSGVSKFTGYYKAEKWIFGTYVASSYSTSEYEGKFVDGKKNGFGVKTLSNYVYVGDVKDDIFKGVYTFISLNSKRVYVYNNKDGDYKKITNEVSLASKISLFSENIADSIATSDKKQCTYGDCENGYGKYTYLSGNSYEGFFTNGYRNGYGIYTLKEGAKVNTYEGTYLANKWNGVGKVSMSDGSIFIGQFKLGKKEGYGVYSNSDKKVLGGLWEKNLYKEWEEDLGFGGGDDPKAKETESKTEKNNTYKPKSQSQFDLK